MHAKFLMGVVIGFAMGTLGHRVYKVLFWRRARKNWLRQIDELQMAKYGHEFRGQAMAQKYASENPRWKTATMMTEDGYHQKTLFEVSAAVLAEESQQVSDEMFERNSAQLQPTRLPSRRPWWKLWCTERTLVLRDSPHGPERRIPLN